MNQPKHMAANADSRLAADWVARLGGAPLEADWLAFEGWLNAAPNNRAAYDKALLLSLEIDAKAQIIADAVIGADIRRETRAARPSRKAPAAWWASAMMGAAAVAVTFAALHPAAPAGPDVYSTAKGQRRDVVLSDGTKVALNTASSISVRMSAGRREITLAEGEAAFTVTHDANRPFVVHTGDRVLTDLGTDFDVSRRGGDLIVTVREGQVGVTRADDSVQRSLKLNPGMRLEHRQGSPDTMVLVADTDQAFAWRAGRLIYRDRPLADVVADLNRYGDDDVKVRGDAAGLRFTGVLTIDNQPAMVRRLTDLLPVSSARKDGVITLTELNSTR